MAGRVLSIGECMIELSQAEAGLLRQGFAGDSFNTAYYLRAFLPPAQPVDYFTAVGTDPVSDAMLAFIDARRASARASSGACRSARPAST